MCTMWEFQVPMDIEWSQVLAMRVNLFVVTLKPAQEGKDI